MDRQPDSCSETTTDRGSFGVVTEFAVLVATIAVSLIWTAMSAMGIL
jgi:hypothetical protein